MESSTHDARPSTLPHLRTERVRAAEWDLDALDGDAPTVPSIVIVLSVLVLILLVVA